MLAAKFFKGIAAFMLFIRLAETAFFGQDDLLKMVFQFGLVGFAVEAFVKAGNSQLREALTRLSDHFNRDGIIGLFFHDLVMKNESVLIFHDADPESQFNRHPGLTFANPFGMRLEDGKELFFMRDGLALDDPAVYLIQK